MKYGPTLCVERYADSELAAEDVRRLEQAGFNPEIRAHDDVADVLNLSAPVLEGHVVVCVPKAELPEALRLLQLAMEAQSDPREAGYV